MNQHLPCLQANAHQFSSQDANLPPSLQITYRLGFETRRIVGNDSKIGDYASTIELVILDVKSGQHIIVILRVRTQCSIYSHL